MSSFVPRSPHLFSGATTDTGARNAALLIDFDNITLGVRSDLGKELKTLLNSEIFSGKVAVRRAYADWRRYPNYVVPLTEASIDLIFAPAYGTSKKNATDLRMAVDAIELAFMRPEIGTFILLTGDSDFSSCVIKLKEYGKYVIGVGMRDSSSDLLIQNCDEYYSYHALSGLVREGDQGNARRDPWLLVREAVQKMAAAGDSMRTDRLKQVMIDLDPNFDEKDEGYSKFSKFVQVAAEKGLIRLHKVENGQFEVAPVEDGAPAPAPQARYDREERYGRDDRGRDRDRDRGRGRSRGGRDRDRGRERDHGGERPAYAEPAPVRLHREDEEPAAAASSAETESESLAAAFPVADAQPVAPFEPAGAPMFEEPAAPAIPSTPEERNAMAHGYALLQHAVRALVSRQGQTARDGDVKRRMLDMDPSFDEHAMGFSKFSRFLRQAHEDQVVDVRRLAEGRYEVALPSSGTKLAPPSLTGTPRPQPIHVDRDEARAPGETAQAADTAAPAEPREGRRDRGRGRRGRGGAEGAPAILPGQSVGAGDPPREQQPAAAEQPSVETPAAQAPRQPEARPEPRQPEARQPEPPAAPPASAPRDGGADAHRGLRHRSAGRRPAWASPAGPPPLLPGQVVNVGGSRPADEPASAPGAEPAPQPSAESSTRPAESAPPHTGFDPAALGLPTDPAGVEAHLSGYRGVGAATVRSLVNAFGARVFETLENDPDAVRGLLGRRAAPILEQWTADRDARRAQAPAAPAAEEPAPAPAPAVDETASAETGDDARDFAEASSSVAPEPEDGDGADVGGETAEQRSRRRGRRGGRNRNRNRGDRAEGASADAASAEAALPGEAIAQAPAGDTDPSLVEPALRPGGEVAAADEAIAAERGGGRSRGRRGRGRGGAAPAETASVEGVELPAGDRGETDPSLMEPAARPAGEAAPAVEQPPRGRSRGRGRSGGNAAPSPEPRAAQPAPEPAPEPAAEAPARQGGRGRGRSGRGGGSAAAAEAAPAPAPAPAAAPAEQGAGRGRGRGARNAAQPAAPTPAPEAQPAPTGGRGRGRGRGAAAPPAEAPQPEPAPPAGEGGGSRNRRGRGRGGRGRGNAPPVT